MEIFRFRQKTDPPSFDALMGKGLKSWRSMKTKEERKALDPFRQSFEERLKEDPSENAPFLIPKKIHLIWVGPDAYPEQSRQYLASWPLYHPGWNIQLWIDRERALLHKDVSFSFVTPELLGEFKDLFEESTNLGEKSDLLRLLILLKEGGLYVDHDVYAKRSFAPLHQNYDFYTGLQNIGNHVMRSPAVVRNSIIGSRPNHDILQKALILTRARWNLAFQIAPGQDIRSTMERVTLRSFAAFHEAVSEKITDPSFNGIVFPAGYFNELDGKYGVFSHESMAGAWYRGEMTFYEKHLFDRTRKLMKRLHTAIGILASLCLINFIGLLYLWIRSI